MFWWYCECTQTQLFAASNDVYAYLYDEKLWLIFIFHLLRKKMHVIALAPPCLSKRASASTFSTNDLIFSTHLSYILKFLLWNACFFMSQIMFMKFKLIKRMINSLSGAGRLVLHFFFKPEFNKHKMFDIFNKETKYKHFANKNWTCLMAATAAVWRGREREKRTRVRVGLGSESSDKLLDKGWALYSFPFN